jgi:hypothetical protein
VKKKEAKEKKKRKKRKANGPAGGRLKMPPSCQYDKTGIPFPAIISDSVAKPAQKLDTKSEDERMAEADSILKVATALTSVKAQLGMQFFFFSFFFFLFSLFPGLYFVTFCLPLTPFFL